MKHYKFFFSLMLLCAAFAVHAQENIKISGQVIDGKGLPIPAANIEVVNSDIKSIADDNGRFTIVLPNASSKLRFTALGFVTVTRQIDAENYSQHPLRVTLYTDNLNLDQVVVSATRDRVARQKAPVVVHTTGEKLFNAINSITVSESLNFTPGVRLETNCQNCNTTAVRMNGLQGGYSQILIDGRPVFSALNGVYGLEIIPTAIVDRIEVVRSGGSALYGANAIAGTINIITKDPVLDSWEINGNLGFLEGETADRSLSFNTSLVSDDLNSGITTYGYFRDRDAHDVNGDGYTEKTILKSNTLGANAFIKPGEHSAFRFNFTGSKSFRRGGNKLKQPPQFSDITEQLEHNTIRGGITYDAHTDNHKNEFSAYISAQHTQRKSYYGGLFGGRTHQDSILANKAFGHTNSLSVVSGGKYIHNFNEDNKLTAGIEYKHESVHFVTPGFNKINDQVVNNYGIYAQYRWKPFADFTTLIGARLDHVNVNGFYTVGAIATSSEATVTEVSPRVTVMYNLTEELKLRAGYARGFRPPRAYQENFEVSSAAGRQQFTVLSNALETEHSNAYTASLNYTNSFGRIQTNFLLEGFYTAIENPFTVVSTGQLHNGRLLKEIRNGSGSYVTGVNFNVGVSPSSDLIFQLGGTVQKSIYKEGQVLFEGDPDGLHTQDVIVDEYVRTPDFYGYISVLTQPLETWSLDLTGTYTGSMVVPHVVSEDGYIELEDTPSFFDLNVKVSKQLRFTDNFSVVFEAGVKNILASYQDDFDKGPLRDADYVYGPSNPRTFFFGISLGNIL